MKKVIVVLILLGAVGAGTYYWKSADAAESTEPEIILEKIERGPIKQIVATTGKVVSNLDVDIKSKASGTVITLPFDISDRVKEKDLLVELDTTDMQRNYEQAKVSLDASNARLKTAEQNLRVAELTLRTDKDRAQANLMSAEMAARDARAKADRVRQLFEKKLASQEECDTAETAAMGAQANLANAKVKLEELKTQEQALEVQRQSVILAQTQVRNDQIALKVADDRLKDCVVLAPVSSTTQPAGRFIPPDWVVTDRKVQTGMIIASGVSNVGGGTSIMTLSDLSRIFVLASVDESDIGKVGLDQPAVITVDAYPSMQFLGRVVRIASKGVNTQNVVTFEVKIEVLGALKVPTAAAGEPASAPASRPAMADGASRERRGDREGRAGREGRPGREGREGRRSAQTRPSMPSAEDLLAVSELLPEKKSLLKPEMTATIEITTAQRENVLQIPVEAVSRQAGQMFANVPGETADVPDRKQVELGITDGIKYELIAGLSEGDTVVIHRGETDSRWANNPARRMGGGSGGAMRVMRMGSRGGR